MPDNAVAAGVTAPDPIRGINTYSGILGLMRQKQQLQTGQYLQQTAGAEAAQATGDVQERQRATSVLQNMEQYGLRDPVTHVVDLPKAIQKLSEVAPKTFGQYLKPLTDGYTAQLDISQKAQDLNRSQQQDVNTGLAGVVADDKIHSYADMTDAIGTLRDQRPDLAHMYTAALGHLHPVGPDDSPKDVDAKMAGNRKILTALGDAALPATSSVGPGGLATPESSVGPSGARINVNRSTGAISAPEVQGATGGKGGLGLNPTTPELVASQATALGGATRAAEAQSTANLSPKIISSLERARDIVESDPSVLRGEATPAFQKVRGLLAGFFGKDIEKAADGNELSKYLAFSSALRARSLGLGGTDAGQDLTKTASPNIKGDATSLPKLIRQSIALEKYNVAYANTQAGGLSPAARADNESKFRSIPRALDVYEASTMRTKEEMDSFLRERKITRADLQESKRQLQAMHAL